MAMGTTEHPKANPTMPVGTPPPGWAGTQDVSKPYLGERDEDVDWVMLLRCYPNAKSKDELRELALKAGADALKMAEEAVASVDVPVPELDPDGNPLPPREPPRPGQPDTRQPPPPPHAPPQPSREAHGKDEHEHEHEHDKKK